MENQKLNAFRPFTLIMLATVLVLLTQYIPEGTILLNYETKEVDFFYDVKAEEDESFIPSSLDNIAFAGIGGCISVNDNIKGFFTIFPGYTPVVENFSGNTSILKNFAKALNNAKNGKVRIAHFGDSVIEGDLISADLRKNLQSQFGGSGVGFVAINSPDIAFRNTTRLSYSDNWKYGAVFASNSDKLPVGLNGAVAYTNGNSWVNYEPYGLYGIKQFHSAKLYYQSDAGGNITVGTNTSGEKTFTLKGSKKIEELDLGLSGRVKNVKITIPAGTKGNFYGVSFEEGNGIYVDNYPLRGNSGIALRDVPESMLKDFSKYLDYDLILLHFGLNMLEQNMKDLSWYESAMSKIISQFKSVYPKAGIVVIGVQDKGIKKGSKFVTEPSVLKLLETQKKIAADNSVAFWNLFEAMGGEGAMSKWVADGKAQKDYTHVNTEGAKKMADLLTDAINDYYNANK